MKIFLSATHDTSIYGETSGLYTLIQRIKWIWELRFNNQTNCMQHNVIIFFLYIWLATLSSNQLSDRRLFVIATKTRQLYWLFSTLYGSHKKKRQRATTLTSVEENRGSLTFTFHYIALNDTQFKMFRHSNPYVQYVYNPCEYWYKSRKIIWDYFWKFFFQFFQKKISKFFKFFQIFQKFFLFFPNFWKKFFGKTWENLEKVFPKIVPPNNV